MAEGALEKVEAETVGKGVGNTVQVPGAEGAKPFYNLFSLGTEIRLKKQEASSCLICRARQAQLLQEIYDLEIRATTKRSITNHK